MLIKYTYYNNSETVLTTVTNRSFAVYANLKIIPDCLITTGTTDWLPNQIQNKSIIHTNLRLYLIVYLYFRIFIKLYYYTTLLDTSARGVRRMV